MVGCAETIEVYDIEVGIHCELNKYMEIYMYQRTRSFFDLCLRSLRMKLDLGRAIQDHWSSGYRIPSSVSLFLCLP